jgi:hypothetical protein
LKIVKKLANAIETMEWFLVFETLETKKSQPELGWLEEN